ncbi:alpha/beta hydrolase [Spirillospora albida]|uniref:alpha/beta hydrolase n=1 Tax=Spirillospora albida TaxID=58123 RepID=UPI0006920CB0|nr:alpha/beta hydrolase [Spirillospora albida]
MPTRDEYESALRGIVMLSGEYASALDRAHRILADGALVGPHAVALERAMIDRDRGVRTAFTDAFEDVRCRALREPGAPLRVASPSPGRPPVGNARARLGVAGGDARLLERLDAEFELTAQAWLDAARALDRVLLGVGADRAAPRRLDTASRWLTAQVPDLRRRRAELLESDKAGAGIAALTDMLIQQTRFAVLTAQMEKGDPELAARLRKTGVDLSLIPLRDGARATAEWWRGLTAEQRKLYIEAFPQVIGWLDGLPARDRDRANRLTLAKRIDELSTKMLLVPELSPYEKRDLQRLRTLQEKIQGLDARAAAGRGPQVFLLGLNSTTAGQWDGYGPKPDPLRYGPPGSQYLPPDAKKVVSNSSPGPDGRVIIALGDPDKAAHTGVYVPGTTTKLDGFSGGDINRIDDLWRAAMPVAGGRPVSTIAWLGYDAPDSLTDAGDGKYAVEGGPRLDRFIDGIRAAQGDGHRHLTLIGHSYGSTVIGAGARSGNGLNVDDIIAVGSPGMKVGRADQLHMSSSRVWSELASGDHVADLGRSSHGGGAQQGPFLNGPPVVPSDPQFGAQRLITDTEGHSDYWKYDAVKGPTRSLLNQALVVAGAHTDPYRHNDPTTKP